MSGTAVAEERATSPVVDSDGEGLFGESGPDLRRRIETISRTAEVGISSVERVCGMDSAGRLAAYEEGMLSLRELTIWAARFPEEVPLINGEFPWIALTLADLD